MNNDQSSTKPASVVVNIDNVEEESMAEGEWGHAWKVLTPSMKPGGGSLGVNHTRVSPGFAAVPFHWHAREDEAFYVLSGRGVLRYGDELLEIGPGDCISCPAGNKIAHQIANPFHEDLCYLAIGPNDPDEVCVYPDSGKLLARSAGRIGFLEDAHYMAGEPDHPRIFDLWAKREAGTKT